MRAILISFLVFLFSMDLANSQYLETFNDKTPYDSYDFYVQKQKANKTTAWVLLGSGVVMTIAGLGINMEGGVLDGDSTNNNKGLWLSYLGGATTVASIPFFISAHKHNRNASISLKNETYTFRNTPFKRQRIVSIAFALEF